MEEFNLLDPVSGCPVKVRFFHIYLGDGFLYYRPVHLILANGKQYHCYFYDDFWARLDQFTEEGKWLWAEKGSKQNLSSDHLLVAVKDILTRGLVEKAFALTPTPESTWHWILEFYNNYPEFPWWEYLKPFREQVVAKIANSPFGRKLYASQSHETLLISPLESWPERNLAPCIIIKPRKNSVRIVKCSKGKITELTPSLGDAWGILEPLLHWLESSVFQILPESKPR